MRHKFPLADASIQKEYFVLSSMQIVL